MELAGEILKAVEELHVRGFIHKDIKPENILIHSDTAYGIRVFLCDFSLASPIGEPYIRQGTPEFFAPEAFSEDISAITNQPTIDSLPVLIFFLSLQ